MKQRSIAFSLAVPNFAEVHLKPEVLARYGLPDIAYPIASADLQAALTVGGELPLAMMLRGLQEVARDGESEWKHLEPAMSRLSELLAPEDGRDVISAAGDTWCYACEELEPLLRRPSLGSLGHEGGRFVDREHNEANSKPPLARRGVVVAPNSPCAEP